MNSNDSLIKEGRLMDKKPVLTMMCGLPRSGKSTWIQENQGNAIIICPDRVWLKVFGVQFYRGAEQFVWGFTNGMANLILEQKKDIIVDATNINHKQRRAWFNIAAEYCDKVRIVWFKTSIKECKARNEKSDKNSRVPPEVIDRMARDFEDPIYPQPYLHDGGVIWFQIELIQFPSTEKTIKVGEGPSNHYLSELTAMKL